MSLDDVMDEQGELRNLIEQVYARFEANEAKIANLMKGGGGLAPRGGEGAGQRPATAPAVGILPGGGGGGGGGGRGGYDGRVQRARRPVDNLGAALGAEAPQQGLGGYPRALPPQAAGAAGYTQVSPSWGTNKPGGKRTSTTEELKGIVQSVVQSRRGVNVDVWAEDKGNVSIAGIDRCEAIMKKAFDEYRRSMATRTTASPVAALQALTRSIDGNHSGKIDAEEFLALPKALGFQASPASINALFERYDLDHSGLIDQHEFCRMIWKPEGDVDARAKGVIGKMREVLVYRTGGFPSMQAMGRQFRIIDRDNSGKLDKEEMDIMLNNFFNYFGIKFTPEEKRALFTFFDKEGDGTVNYNEYIRAVRGDMNGFREEWVRRAFSILDVNNSGEITKDEIMSKYDVSKNPDVQSGKISAGDAYTLFMNNYDANEDGIITLDEFMEGYNWISASIDNDDYFELMMRNAWHIGGGEGWAANTANLNVLVTYGDGRQEVVALEDDLGLDKFDERAVLQRLHDQGCRNILRVELYGGMEM